MRRKATRKSGNLKRPKTKLGLPDLDHSKSAVLNSLRSPESKRGYRHAIETARLRSRRFCPLEWTFTFGAIKSACISPNMRLVGRFLIVSMSLSFRLRRVPIGGFTGGANPWNSWCTRKPCLAAPLASVQCDYFSHMHHFTYTWK
jgi:hypothetical protein